ncbi:hypothetical protein [Rhodanobacter aciditrophus]|uniref:hypothetical protein n=1 Tax=Rhodanobacter aciditrophus TaxID=1623218 RepID=UPI003CF1C1F2
MGDIHRFAELKKYSTKTYGMHQSAMIDSLSGNAMVEVEVANDVEGGMCGTLVVYWLKEMLTTRQDSWFLPRHVSFMDKKDAKQQTQKFHNLMAGFLAPKHAEYHRLRKKGDSRPCLLILAPDVPGKMSAKVKVDSMDIKDLEAFGFKASRGYYVTLICEHARHAVGIFGQAGGKITFFDPNAGEYEISGIQWGHFIEVYKEIIETKTSWGTIKSVRLSSARVG